MHSGERLIEQLKQGRASIDFSVINRDDHRLLSAIADRAVALARDFKVRNKRDDLIDPEHKLIMVDLCVVHIRRELALLQLLMTSDLEFGAELFSIMRHINRVDCTFPADVHLRYAKKRSP